MREFAGEPPIEERVGDRLREAEMTVATAEACTGGLITALLTDVPGSSAYVDRGFVTYAYDSLREVLGVTREQLDEHGAVSVPVTRAMARSARDRADTTWGLATTGIAGPDGGTPDKPVGTVFVGLAYAAPWGTEASYARVERYEFEGSRLAVKERAARAALEWLFEAVEEDDTPPGTETA
ncbi:MAG: CinA family protein [Halobacteriales archaeon]